MSRLDKCHNIAGLREAARGYLPRLVFDYIDGGVDDETCLRRNRDAFEHVTLLPDYLVDVSQLSLHRTLLGRRYNMPLGMAPTGLASFARHGADLMLARAANHAGVPFVLSGAGTASIEAAAQAAPEQAWFQLYVSREQRITEDLVRRALMQGCSIWLSRWMCLYTAIGNVMCAMDLCRRSSQACLSLAMLCCTLPG